ncbi:hypothetical protein Pint_05545 [Pistacia integerrima]|uniref:Uncharacterized protein n=1 Tax=Pistacia integerrima TaxID=434235 RepID=A0ACC0Z619_9ROSI|nr:hypothetical protein Pint_05545 [Pistacia integerrima]
MKISNCGDDNNETFVEIVLEIIDDSVAINSIYQGEAVLEDPELFSLLKKALENRSSSSSVSFSLFGNTCSYIKLVSKGLKRQTKSAAAHILKGLKFI